MPRGGYRPGSGRRKGSTASKPSPAVPSAQEAMPNVPAVAPESKTPLEYLISVMNDPTADGARRDRAAAIAIGFMHGKAGDTGKKAERQQAAEQAIKGKFAPAAPPKLVVNNR